MIKQRFCVCILCFLAGLGILLGLLFATPGLAQAQTAPVKKHSVSFINEVAPILKESCLGCHDAKKRKGKLDMSTYESFRKGGRREDPVTAGKPEESLILDLLTAKDNARMPPREAGDALPAAKIAIIRQWIAEGAGLDAGVSPRAELLRELRVRWTPPDPPQVYPFPVAITAMAFTPDSQKLVVSGQHELTVWDLAQGKLTARIYTRAERAYAMVFLPDGKLAVAGGRPGQEGDVRLYNLQGSKSRQEHGIAVIDGVRDPAVMVKQLVDSDDSVLCLALSPDGKRLASGGCDRIVNVWDLPAALRDPRPSQQIENHADWVFGLAFAADGKHLLTCSRDKTAKVWDLVSKESVLTFPEHQAPVYGVAIRPDSKLAVSVGEDAQVRAWNATGEAKQLHAMGGHGKAIFKVLYHPKLPLVVTCSADGSVRSWNPDNGQAVRTFAGHSDWVYGLALSPDGNFVASGSWNGEVKVWNLADGKLVKSFNASPGIH